MQTLILIDPNSSRDAITAASAALLNAGARVRVTSVEHVTAADFDGMTFLVLACPLPADARIQQATRCLTTIHAADVPRMLWFRRASQPRAV